jgi:hypothetical protein
MQTDALCGSSSAPLPFKMSDARNCTSRLIQARPDPTLPPESRFHICVRMILAVAIGHARHVAMLSPNRQLPSRYRIRESSCTLETIGIRYWPHKTAAYIDVSNPPKINRSNHFSGAVPSPALFRANGHNKHYVEQRFIKAARITSPTTS